MKTDITIERNMTINTGNFSSIRPNVSITLKDVDILEVHEIYQKIESIVDCLFSLETATLIQKQEVFKGSIDRNLKSIAENIENNKENINKELEELIKR